MSRIFALVFFFSVSTSAFVGRGSTEATLWFSHLVEIPSEKRPTLAQTKEAVEEQLLYLFGPLSAAKVFAVPKGEHTVTNVRLVQKASGLWEAHYDYQGMIQIKAGPRTRYEVILPRQLSEEFIYQKRCTDSHYPDFEDYWYFWNPANPGCSLEERRHYDVVPAKLGRFKNTVRTYPKYNDLADPRTNEILFYVFFGMDDPEKHSLDPDKSRDENAVAFRSARKRLIEMGFEGERMDAAEMRRILKGRKFRRPYVEVFRKETEKAPVEIRLYFGPTGICESSNAFHYFYKEASENASVLIYDGHSGLGGHLDLKAIEKRHGFKIRFPESRYQIFFFNSCTSYTYYNTVYFYRKSARNFRTRTESLDILTNGLGTPFDLEQIANMALIEAVVHWGEGTAIRSYQQLAKVMDSGYLFGVNGDEDNPIYQEQVRDVR